ncbi:hypothetical protein ACE1TF_11450 [Geomicrobium sp. JSM 1781026]
MNGSSILKWISGGLEAVLAIPVLGFFIYWTMGPTPMIIMLGLHILTLVMSVNDGKKKHGSILGIVTAFVAFIPVIGMMMHAISATLLMVDAKRSEKAIEM